MKKDAVPKIKNLKSFNFVDSTDPSSAAQNSDESLAATPSSTSDVDPLFILPYVDKSVQVQPLLRDKVIQTTPYIRNKFVQTTECKRSGIPSPIFQNNSSTSLKYTTESTVGDSSVGANISNTNTFKITDELDLIEYQTLSLKRTLLAIKKNPFYYIGIREEYLNLVQIIAKQICEKDHYVLLCLNKIRRNTPFLELGDNFGISESYASKIFTKCLPLIADCLSNFIFWPSKKSILNNLPISFRFRYSNVQSIIDCFEMEIEKPANPRKEALSWSEYKQCNTIKYLVSMTPYGLINFVSNGFIGSVTDQNIIKDSKYLDKLPAGAAVMVVRGFKHVEHLILSKGCFFIRPPSVFSIVKPTKKEVVECKKNAALKLHAEQVVKRFREYLFLSTYSTIDNNLIQYTDYVVNIVGALINLQEPII